MIFVHAFAEERENVDRHLHPTPPQPSEDSLSSARMTLTNGGDIDIRLLKFTCYARTMHLDNGMSMPAQGFGHDLGGVTLYAGGTGESLACTPDRIIKLEPPAATTCADISWWIDYILVDQPTRGLRKEFRLILQPGHKQWEEVANDSAQLSCPGDPKGPRR